MRAQRGHPVQDIWGAQRVAHAQPGQRPRLRQAAQHHHVGKRLGRQRGRLTGNRVGERLVDHHDAARPPQRKDLIAQVQHRGRVGRVADHDEVGIVGHTGAGQTERRRQHDVPERDACRGKGGFGLGERRRDQRGQPGAQVGQKRETLGSPGQQRHLVDTPAVPGSDGMHRALFIGGARVPAEVGQPGGQPVNQPRRRRGGAHIDGEVEHAGRRGLVAVVARGGTGLTGHSTTVDVGDNGVVTETLRSTVAARPQLVIFDLDGTLTDSAQGIVSSFRHALVEVGAAVPDGDLASRIVGPPMHHTLREMGLGKDADAAIAAYRADYTTRGWAMNSLFDGIAALLADLQAAGVRLAVATSKAEPTARRILAHFGLDEHFEVIAGASVDGSRATKSDVVAHALGQLHPLPDRVLMVGDRSHDVEGAAEHGIDTVVVGWGYGRKDFADPHAVRALAHVATIDDLREVLGV